MLLLGVGSKSNNFDPRTITGLKAWFKADIGTFQNSAGTTPATTDGDPIGNLKDQSGNSNNITQGTSSKKPTLKLAIQNGLPVIRTDGIDDFLVNTFTLSNILTFLMVFRVNSTGTEFLFDGSAITDSLGAYVNGGTTMVPFSQGSDGTSLSYTTGEWAVFNATYNGTGTGAGHYHLYGGADTTSNFGGIVRNPDGITLGSRRGGSFSAQIDIAELLIYEGVVSDSNRVLLDTYLNGRWTIY